MANTSIYNAFAQFWTHVIARLDSVTTIANNYTDAHNTSTTAHSDIRTLVSDLSTTVDNNRTDLINKIGAKVPKERTVNGKALSENITLTASDVNADAKGQITEQNASAIRKIWTGTKAQYDLVTTKASDTLYFVTDADGESSSGGGGNSGTADATEIATYIDAHNTSTSAHADIRTLITQISSTATSTAKGLMSATDKSKLDGITASADAVSFSQKLTSGTEIGTITINGTATKLYAPTATSSSGGSTVSFTQTQTSGTKIGTLTIDGTGTTLYAPSYSAATTSASGLMSATDKSKLDGITASADAVSVSRSFTTGTKIASVSVNSTSYALYAPITYSTTDLTAGTSTLTTGMLYVVYE